jgi:hypothetical protein
LSLRAREEESRRLKRMPWAEREILAGRLQGILRGGARYY